jgi:uncharacterized protein (DUF1800 family)
MPNIFVRFVSLLTVAGLLGAPVAQAATTEATSSSSGRGSVTATAATSVTASPTASGIASDETKVRHLLNRITYGPRSGDIDQVQSMGIDRYIEEQLNPQSIALPDAIVAYTKEPALKDSPANLFLSYGRDAFDDMARAARKKGPGGGTDVAVKKEIQQLVRDNYQELYAQTTDARLMRALYSPRQLEEVMTDFWFNHFNVSIDKGLDHLWVGSYEENAIRPYALGKFRELLGATAHHAAMLFYLDNWQNTAPNRVTYRPGPKNKKFSGLNENYARELMELHTLGVDGGYAQKDVVELARVLTGHGLISKRSIAINPAGMSSKFGYYFDADRHDYGDKILLGHTIKGRGVEELEEALDQLTKHPSTAKFVSYKLAQYFTCDEPAPTLVDKLAKTFQRSDGDIKEMMRVLLKSNEFWDARNVNAKFKSPYRYLISSLRASQATINNTKPLLGFLKLQGMPLYQCQTPDGYKNTERAWLSSTGLLQRITFATALGAGRHPAARIASVSPEEIMRIAGIKPTDRTGEVVASSPKPLRLSLLFGSPEFMKY